MVCKKCYFKKCYFKNKTRITTIIKEKLKKSDDQTRIEKYGVAANITEYRIQIISYQSYHPINHHFKIHDDKSINM